MPLTKKQQAERLDAIENLKNWFPPGSTVYTILRHVSRSGMRREIGILANMGNEDFRHPNYAVATALGYPLGKGDGIKVDGCGMDMGFSVAYNLSATLYPTYKCLGKDCPSPDHRHNQGNVPRVKNRATHTDGYCLSHKWL